MEEGSIPLFRMKKKVTALVTSSSLSRHHRIIDAEQQTKTIDRLARSHGRMHAWTKRDSICSKSTKLWTFV
jgi:hypothetical protein